MGRMLQHESLVRKLKFNRSLQADPFDGPGAGLRRGILRDSCLFMALERPMGAGNASRSLVRLRISPLSEVTDREVLKWKFQTCFQPGQGVWHFYS